MVRHFDATLPSPNLGIQNKDKAPFHSCPFPLSAFTEADGWENTASPMPNLTAS